MLNLKSNWSQLRSWVVEPEEAQPEEQPESAEVVEPEEAQPEEQPESAEVVEPKEAQSPEAQDSEKEKA
jgi:hypothetical protein